MFGGEVKVRERKGSLYLEQAMFRVHLKVIDPDAALHNHSLRGEVVIDGRWAPLGKRYLYSAVGLFCREFGF